MKIYDLIKPLLKGNIVDSPVVGKKLQLTVVPSLIVLSLIVQLFHLPITPEQLNALSAGIDTIAVLLNSYWTASTTDKIGL